MVPIIDAGHGGIINGKYQTAGKRSPYFPDGTQLYEGVYNRIIMNNVIEMLEDEGIQYLTIYDGNKDMPLHRRSIIANDIADKVDDDVMLISIHANADGDGSRWTKPKGIETFYYPSSTEGKKYAKQMQELLIKYTGGVDRGIKSSKFYILRKTSMPAILIETGFMTNMEECSKLKSSEYQNQISKAIVEFIKNINQK